MADLHGRLVVVTGAGRGLGLAMAEAVGARGGRVVVAEVVPERGRSAVDVLSARGIEATFVRTDVADPGSVAALAEEVAAMGPLWGLVNNAGLADTVGGKTFWELEPAEWDAVHTVNARGPWLVARALAPAMLAAGEGRIVNIASDTALYGSPRLAHYVASKGAVIALTRAMARDAGHAGVTVNAVAPGLVVGESTARLPAERHELYASRRAITRPQQPEDVVGAVTFLLSDDARYVTGQTLVVDGGFVMG